MALKGYTNDYTNIGKETDFTMKTKITTGAQLAAKAIRVAKECKTLYVMGCFGAPMNAANKKRYTANHSYNKQAARTSMIRAASADTFGFDCVCLIKGLLWGWCADTTKNYGGAVYKANNVPDIGADQMIAICKEVSTNFNIIEVGEAVWMSGHIGIYVGNGLAVECTPVWDNKVQITACNCDKSGYHRRNWTKHGKLPYVTYGTGCTAGTTITTTETTEKKEGGNATQKETWIPKKGDTVYYNGNVYYNNANAATGFSCKGGLATITLDPYRLGKSKHPYHLVRVSGKGSTVWGWVDAGSFTKA